MALAVEGLLWPVSLALVGVAAILIAREVRS